MIDWLDLWGWGKNRNLIRKGTELIRKETELIRRETELIRKETERLRRENKALRSITPEILAEIVKKSMKKDTL